MILPRIIPCLLIDNQDLVKTVKFNNAKYIGDPINTVRIFNELEVDELIILDISASKSNKTPDYKFINEIVSEAFMPLAIGGGIKCIEHATKLIKNGVEKVILNDSLKDSYDLIKQISKKFGSQSVVVSIDIKKTLFGKYKIYNHVKKNFLNFEIETYLKSCVEAGAGEIFLNFVDKDGTYNGYDFDLIKSISHLIPVPLIVCGGAKDMNDFEVAIRSGANACAAGSLFIYKGVNKAVMINYPGYQSIYKLFNNV